MLAKWLNKLGVYAWPDFFEPDFCAQLCAELCQAPVRQAIITHGLDFAGVDESYRRTKVIQPATGIQTLLQQRVTAALPQLSEHFQQPLAINEPPKCLRYASGDFFQVHRDVSPGKAAPPLTLARRVSLVAFLNSDYAGGELVLYDLLRETGAETKGIALSGLTGWLIAFRADLRHEVLPVKTGERYTVVSWLTAAPV